MDLAGRPMARTATREDRTASVPPLSAQLLPQVQSAAAAAGDALAAGKSVVVSGAAGTGKSAVLARVLGQLSGEYSVLRLRGAASLSEKPFGGLFWLLSELPPETLSNPVYVLQFVRRVLEEKAAGGRLVLAIEHAEDLDSVSIAILLQLCRGGCAQMLATVRNVAACPEDFVHWWAGDPVHREDLIPLRPSGTRLLLEGMAGAPVSSRLLMEVQARSLGNPRLAALFFEEQLLARTVLKRRGIWVWTGSVSYAGTLAERVDSETGTLGSAERLAVETLALTGGLPLEVLLRLADPAAVERLEESALVEASGQPRALRLKDPLLAEAAAALVPHGRAAEIRARIAGRSASREDIAAPSGAFGAAPGTGGREGQLLGLLPGEPRFMAVLRAARELAACGQWSEAIRSASMCLDTVLINPAAPGLQRSVLSELFHIFLSCGELRRAASLLEHTDSFLSGMEILGSNDLCEGMVQVLGGRADRALDYLQRALVQLDQEETPELAQLAATAAAYACVLLKDRRAGLDYLDVAAVAGKIRAAEDSTGAAADLIRCFSGLCAARGMAGDPDTVTVPSGGCASLPAESAGLQDQRSGRSCTSAGAKQTVARLPVLAAAALQGCSGAAEMLREEVRGCSGTAADMYLDLARGLLESDVPCMLSAAETATVLGHFLIAYEAAGGAARRAREQSDRQGLRAARRIENASYRMLLAANSVTDRLLELSEFERELALGAAAGRSSSHLGNALHLSPRTIDWHLGRIFQKLRVSGRAELRECLKTERQQT